MAQGARQALHALISFEQERHMLEQMKWLSFDTSASNTGTYLPSILATYSYEDLFIRIAAPLAFSDLFVAVYTSGLELRKNDRCA